MQVLGQLIVFAPVFLAGMLCVKFPFVAAVLILIPVILIEWAKKKERQDGMGNG